MASLNVQILAESEMELEKILEELREDSCIEKIRVRRKDKKVITLNIKKGTDTNNYHLDDKEFLSIYFLSNKVKNLITSQKGELQINANESCYWFENSQKLEIIIICDIDGNEMVPYNVIPLERRERYCATAYFSIPENLVTIFIQYKNGNVFVKIEKKYLTSYFKENNENEVYLKREVLFEGDVSKELPEYVSQYNNAFYEGLKKITDAQKPTKAIFRYGENWYEESR